MASLGIAVVAALKANAGVTALTTNIIPSYSPQREPYPLIIYDCPDGEPDMTYDGSSGLIKKNCILKCVARTYAAADAMGEAVKGAIADQAGVFGGVTIQRFFWDNDADDEWSDPAE